MNLPMNKEFQKIHAKIMLLKTLKEEFVHHQKFANNVKDHHHQLINLGKIIVGLLLNMPTTKSANMEE